MIFNLLAVLPLLFGYEILALWSARHASLQVRNRADVIFKALTQHLGEYGPSIISGVLIATIAVGLIFRKRGTHICPEYFLYAIVESVVYALLTGLFLNAATGYLLLSIIPALNFPSKVMLALGAGIYEELLFRVILFGLPGFIISQWVRDHWVVYLALAVFSSLAFSLFHYHSAREFDMYSGLFRFLAGLLFCALYRLRGLGIAAWTHALYDFFLIFR